MARAEHPAAVRFSSRRLLGLPPETGSVLCRILAWCPEGRSRRSRQEEELDQLSKLIREVKGELPAISTPTLVLHSGEDDLTSTKKPDYVEEKIGSKIVRKIILDDSYHMMTIDNQKDRVAEETINFFMEQIASAEFRPSP